jgi:hypothetical protein
MRRLHFDGAERGSAAYCHVAGRPTSSDPLDPEVTPDEGSLSRPLLPFAKRGHQDPPGVRGLPGRGLQALVVGREVYLSAIFLPRWPAGRRGGPSAGQEVEARGKEVQREVRRG